jgi:hypothetical protein
MIDEGSATVGACYANLIKTGNLGPVLSRFDLQRESCFGHGSEDEMRKAKDLRQTTLRGAEVTQRG